MNWVKLDNVEKKVAQVNYKQEGTIMFLFPTPVVLTNIGRSFTEDEINCIANIPTYKEESYMCNHGSKDRYIFDTFAEELKDIKKFCEYQSKNYLEEIDGANTDHAALRITQSWLSINNPQDFHLPHFHPNSYLSGVLYINCLPNDSIVFSDRTRGNMQTMEFQKKKSTEWNSMKITQNIIRGDLILFPSWVAHGVNKNETINGKRISLAFNTFPTGEIGDYQNLTHLKL